MIKLSFCQNDPPIVESFWQKYSLITCILFELCLFRYLVQSTYFRDTLYVKSLLSLKLLKWIGVRIWSWECYRWKAVYLLPLPKYFCCHTRRQRYFRHAKKLERFKGLLLCWWLVEFTLQETKHLQWYILQQFISFVI